MIRFIKNPFLPKDRVTMYHTTDSMEVYANNRRILGKDWIFYDTPVEYRFNSHSYRMNGELDQIDYNNYIIFYGCSNTVGVGLNLTDTYSYRVSRALGMDYINTGVVGCSNQYIVANIVESLGSATQLPKVMVVNWTYKERIYYYHNDMPLFKLPDGRLIEPFKQSYREYIEYDEHRNHVFITMRNTARTIAKLAGIKLVEFTMIRDFTDPVDDHLTVITVPPISNSDLVHVNNVNKYFARDIQQFNNGSNLRVGHPGLHYQQCAVDYILNAI